MIRAHFPPFDTVSTYTQPEKKVDPPTWSGEAELTYQDTRQSNYKKQEVSSILSQSRISVPADMKFKSSDKTYLQEVLLAILQNPMTDINNLSSNMNAARWYAEQVSKSIDNS